MLNLQFLVLPPVPFIWPLSAIRAMLGISLLKVPHLLLNDECLIRHDLLVKSHLDHLQVFGGGKVGQGSEHDPDDNGEGHDSLEVFFQLVHLDSPISRHPA